MDNKKKFFIGLGILSVVYIAVVGLNLTHKNESNDDGPYSEDKVLSMLESGGGNLKSFFTIAEDVKGFFSFLLPEIDLFNAKEVSIYSGSCQFNEKNKHLIITRNEPCILSVKESDDASRLFTFTYKRQKKSQSARAVKKFNTKNLMLANANVIQPKVMVGTVKWADSKKPSENKNKEKYLTLVLKDSKKGKTSEANFIKENEKTETVIPQTTDKLIIECLVCKDYDIHITQN